MNKEEFKKELERLINKYSMENGSNTPDFIIADYLVGCLDAYDTTVNAREKWYGRGDFPILLGSVPTGDVPF